MTREAMVIVSILITLTLLAIVMRECQWNM